MIYPSKNAHVNKLNSIIKTTKTIILKFIFKYVGIESFVKNIKLNDYFFKLELSTKDFGLSRQLYFTGWREYYSTNYYIYFLNRTNPKYILDIGSNIGYFACIAKAVLKDSFVICVEPVLKNSILLKRNIELNNFNNVQVFHLGIGIEDGKSSIYTFDFDNWATFNSNHANSLIKKGYKCKEEIVETVKLSSLYETLQLPIDLIRMDIEGYEYELLKSNFFLLKNNCINIFMEFHANILEKEKVMEIFLILKSVGYHYCTIIFNNPFCHNDEYFKNVQHKPQKITLDALCSEINSYTNSFIKYNDGFELFITKSDIN